MSRTRDLALARMRMVVARWQQPGGADPAPAPVPGSGRGTAPAADEVDALATPDPGGSGWDGPGAPVRAPVALRLLVGLVVLVVGLGAWTLARSWPRPDPRSPAPHAVLTDVGPTHATAPGPSPDGAAADSGEGAPAAAQAPFGAATPSPSLVVHVAGDVRRPGLVVLPHGSRVGDAVEAAGGVRRGGSLGAANLARVLSDGERIEIGAQSPEQSGAGTAAEAGAGGAPAAGPIDLNSATAEQLDALPGVGPVTAAKILAWRAEHGRFTVVDELAEVPGIGPKTLEELRPHVRI